MARDPSCLRPHAAQVGNSHCEQRPRRFPELLFSAPNSDLERIISHCQHSRRFGCFARHTGSLQYQQNVMFVYVSVAELPRMVERVVWWRTCQCLLPPPSSLLPPPPPRPFPLPPLPVSPSVSYGHMSTTSNLKTLVDT